MINHEDKKVELHKPAKCIGSACGLRETCERYTRPSNPAGETFMNWNPFKKGDLKGKCLFIIRNEE